jgi:hypothetical protein
MDMRWLLTALACQTLAAAPAGAQNWREIQAAFGRTGAVAEGVLHIPLPRTDLEVRLDGEALDPDVYAEGWIGFQPLDGDRVRVMGELPVLVAELQPVLDAMREQGVEVTAIHNHLIGTSPPIMFTHFRANGNGIELARRIRSVVERTAMPLEATERKEPPTRDWSEIEAILDAEGEASGRVVSFNFPRNEPLSTMGTPMPSTDALETASELNFQDLSDGRAAAVGEYIVIESEAVPVTRKLEEEGFNVTALHNHMLEESPRLLFLHFWKFGEPNALARAARAALDLTNSGRKDEGS